MAIATNTSLTYSSVAIREDLSNVIYSIAPFGYPLHVRLCEDKC